MTDAKTTTDQLFDSMAGDSLGRLLQWLAEAIVGLDASGHCIFANDAALALLGYNSAAELQGQPVSRFISLSPVFAVGETVLPLADQLTDAGRQPAKPVYLRKSDGSVIPYHCWFLPVQQNQKPIGTVIGFPPSQQQDSYYNLSRDRYQLLVESTQVVLWEYDIRTEYFTYISPQAEQMFGYPIPKWHSKGFWESIIHPEDKDCSLGECTRRAVDEDNYEIEYRMVRADDSIIYVQDQISVIREDDKAVALRGLFVDITEQKQHEEELRLASVAFDSSDAVIITNAEAEIIRVNRAFCQITGYQSEEVVGKNPSILSSGQHDPAFYQQMWADINQHHHWQGEIWNKRKNGDVYPEWLTISSIYDDDGGILNYVGVFSDISDKKQEEERSRYRDSHDTLTGLVNRTVLYDKIRFSLAQHKDQQLAGALLLLDIDEFKLVNDSMGHKYGDQLLQLVAEKLKQDTAGGDVLARIGGDEFAVFVPVLGNDRNWVTQYIEQQACQLLRSLNTGFVLGEREFHVSVSIGISVFAYQKESASDILRQADAAMFRAKEAGKNNVKVFSPDMHQEIERKLLLHNELSKAIKQQNLELYYQPVFDIYGEITSAEALLRWNHKTEGFISPAEFIPIAEKTGLILPLGRWVLTEVFRSVHQWMQHSDFPLQKIAINVSCQQFEEEGFIHFVTELYQQYKIPYGLIEFELTEEVMAADIDYINSVLLRLKGLGVNFALDDFGTGYSSLQYIKQLPIDNLKIDRSFVKDLPHGRNDCVLVETIISMARHLEMQVTAEGIETREQAGFLRDKQCDCYQGYFFSKPIAREAFEKLINNS